mmetsp:Transcript_5080/g.9002  ORF Transcript_5080/g.9002 Transcript_5080/m.9002 type:complete len:545 (+) Transcript_5080:141-1775(+)
MSVSNTSSPSKKPKMETTQRTNTTDGEDDFERVKRYLLQCPDVSQDSPVIRCAIDAIEKEKQRRIRDAKLQRKFGVGAASAATGKESQAVNGAVGSNSIAQLNSTMSDGDVVVVESAIGVPRESTKDSTAAEEDENDDMMEWQDVQQQKDEDDQDTAIVDTEGEMMETSFLGKELSKISIDSIAEHRVLVSTPTAAIAVALHASLRSSLLGFACTGIPEDQSAAKTCGGFAPPVRELPKTQFLPLHWEDNPNNISLRYRKNGTGAIVLSVIVTRTKDDGDMSTDAQATVVITLFPANSKEPPSQSMEFSLSEHVNLDSWNAALRGAPSEKNHRISPSLHYKRLATMLSKFCRTFDLGGVVDTADATAAYVDNTVLYGMKGTTSASSSRTSSTSGLCPMPSKAGEIPVGVAWKEGRTPSTLDQAFPRARGPLPGGDFADDLLPGGLQDPRFFPGRGGGSMGGNLMGPNHPMFTGGGWGVGGEGPPIGGPGSMQPRFDPVYPPGVDDGVSSNRRKGGRQKPSRTGEPNPDHLPPPNSLGGADNMFL